MAGSRLDRRLYSATGAAAATGRVRPQDCGIALPPPSGPAAPEFPTLNVKRGPPKVYITTRRRAAEPLHGSTLVFDTLRTGLPDSKGAVVENASPRPLRAAIHAAAASTGWRRWDTAASLKGIWRPQQACFASRPWGGAVSVP